MTQGPVDQELARSFLVGRALKRSKRPVSRNQGPTLTEMGYPLLECFESSRVPGSSDSSKDFAVYRVFFQGDAPRQGSHVHPTAGPLGKELRRVHSSLKRRSLQSRTDNQEHQ